MPEPTWQNDTTCPDCGARQKLQTNATGVRPPRDGDIAVCWRCRSFSLFAVGPLGLFRRKPTQAEDEEIRADPRLRTLLGAAAESFTPTEAAALSRGAIDGQ